VVLNHISIRLPTSQELGNGFEKLLQFAFFHRNRETYILIFHVRCSRVYTADTKHSSKLSFPHPSISKRSTPCLHHHKAETLVRQRASLLRRDRSEGLLWLEYKVETFEQSRGGRLRHANAVVPGKSVVMLLSTVLHAPTVG
jgi:hypothetical protein